MMQEEPIILGTREQWGEHTPFIMKHADRRHHLYAIGKSGTGKTTLLRNLILQDIEAGRGVGVLDPHGDLATDLLDHIPRWRTNQVVYFNPSDSEYPIGINLVGCVPKDQRHLVVSGIVGAFKSIWMDSWGPRLEYILYAAFAALVECENVSLLGVQRMLHDDRYRAWVVKQVKDPIVRSFWLNEFANYEKRFVREVVAPIQNKVGQLLMSPHLRNILGQVRTAINARSIMDKRHVFIADLSKGKLGEDKVNLIGALLVTQFQQAAMSRADIHESERKDFHLYVDEFHSFTTDSFASILSEARKYRLCLTLSHQFIDQVRPEIQRAIFGNVGSLVAFRVGQRDAEVLEKEFGGAYHHSQFVSLGNHEVCVKLLAEGSQREPFMGKTLPSHGKRYGRRDKIVKTSRERHATKRTKIEERIGQWIGH